MARNTEQIDTPTSGLLSENSWLRRTAFGQVITIDFFLRHWLIVLSVVGLVIFYISGKYLVMTNMREQKRLERQLEIVETERIRERELYMSRIRESQLTEMIDTARLGLRVQNKPAYDLDAR
ncbi:MAG: FtsL-like putative cell division protein [Clostridium sp.]|nr:FtsL-like putative cell division protein [Clostridium sp.]